MGYFWDIPSGSLKHGQLQKSLGEMSMSNERADMSMFFEIVASQMCSAIVCYSIRLSMVNAHQLGIQTSCTFAYRLAKRFSGC